MKKDYSEVKAWEDEITIPTYLSGPEDQNPPILMKRRNPIHPGSSIVYPYPIQENLTNTCEDKVWKVLYLENDYLRIALLPDLGGRLLYVLDKITGEDALYHNHVIKYARIGIRGAWVSGGIEWNFPNGHTVIGVSHIDYAIRENDDGSVTVLVGDLERVSRMKWTVGITLYKEYAYFETEIRLFNRTALPNRFWFWANSAAPASKGLEFVSTVTKVMTLKGLMSFPTHDGIDINWDRNHTEAQDMFNLNPKEEFVGWYNHDLERGLINFADRSEARGTKFYTWGNSDDGDIWVERLTDNDGQYAEMQSGRFPTMAIWEILSPYSVESWKEVWYPIRRIGSPGYANQEAAFSLERTKENNKIRIGVHVTSFQEMAEISLRAGKKNIWTEKKNLDPNHPYTVEVPVKDAKVLREETTLTLTAANGEILAQYHRGRDAEAGPEIKEYIKIEPSGEASGAEARWLNGIDHEKLGDEDRAREAYENALKDDPGFSQAHLSLGILHLRGGNVSTAILELNKVLERNSGDYGARFYLGVCFMSTEQFDKAIEEFRVLMRSRLYRAASTYLLGGLYLGMGNISKAIQQLEKSCGQSTENHDAEALLACALRKKQRLNEANSHALSVLKNDPMNFLALAEAFFIAEAGNKEDALKGRKERLKNYLRDEVQSYLELATDYARFGLYLEGIKILSLYKEETDTSGKKYPLIDYYLGYYFEKIKKEKAQQYFGSGAKADPSFVFPHRLESETVLRRVLELFPDDRRAMYYLGNLLCARNRPREAIELWEKAAENEKNFSVVHRNLGRAYWRVLGDSDRALKEYELALACDPNDYKLYYELDRLYVACGMEEKRGELINKIPEALKSNDVIAERLAIFYTDRGDYNRTLEILHQTYFFPWEVYKGVRLLYLDANIARGMTLVNSGKFREAIESFKEVLKYPRNIGVGEPAHKANAEALYRIGLACEKMGDQIQAKEFWEKAAAEDRPQWNDLCYYKARALQRLGKKAEADSILNGLLSSAEESLRSHSGDEAENRYLMGLAHKGKGNRAEALRCFKEALDLKKAHRRCSWEISGILGE